MNKVLIIGMSDVTRVIVPILCRKGGMADEICIASKSKEECDELKRQYKDAPVRIVTAGVDVTNEEKALLMMRIFGPNLIINLAPAWLNKEIMSIAVKIGSSYIDTKYYADETGRTCLIEEQFEMAQSFASNNITGVTGCSFNMAAFICLAKLAVAEKTLDSIDSVDIIDISKNSDPSISIPSMEDLTRLSKPAQYLKDGEIAEAASLSVESEFSFDDEEPTKIYMFSSPIIDTYQRGMPEIKNVRYFADLEQNTVNVASTLRDVGMLGTTPVSIKGVEIAPLDFLSKVLPTDVALGRSVCERIKGVILSGKKDGEDKDVFMYFKCKDSDEPSKFGVNTSSYFSAITLLAGASLIRTEGWNIPGVFTPGDFDPELLLAKMSDLGIKYSMGLDFKKP